MRRTGGRPPGEYEQAWRDGTLGQVPARGPGSRPRRPPEGGGHGRRALPRRAPPAPAGAPPRTPALLRDAPAGHDGCGGRRVSPRRPRDGCHGTPAQVKGASGVAGDNAEASPLTSPGNPRRNAGCPTRRCPTPPGRPGGRSPPTRRGSWTAQLDRCSIKQKRKNDQTVVPPGGGTVEDNSHPDQSIWGESSLHQTRGAPEGFVGGVFGVAVEAFDGVAQGGVALVPGRAAVGQVLAVTGADVRGDGDRRSGGRSSAVRAGGWSTLARPSRGEIEAWRSGQISPGWLPRAGQDSRW